MKRVKLIGILLSIFTQVGSLLLPLNASAAPACHVRDIKIRQFKVVNDGKLTTKLLGEIANNCNEPTGVQIKVVFYGKRDQLITVTDMWPASVNNIAPHSNYPFQVTIEKVEHYEKVEASVIGVTTW